MQTFSIYVGMFSFSCHYIWAWGFYLFSWYMYSGGNLFWIPCWFCTFAHWQRNDLTIIVTVGLLEQNNNKIIQKNVFKKSYKLIWILMREISIWPLRKTWLSTWWQNPCCQSQRSDVSCSWPPGLHTSQEGFCPTLLAEPLQVIKVLRLAYGNSTLQLPPQIFYGIKVWRLARPLQDRNVLLLEPLLCCLGFVFWVIVIL